MIDTVALREKVLDLAIRGKLVPQDPNDEPASVLLERIRAQKQQLVKEGKLKAKDIKDDSIIFVGEDNLHYEKFADGTVKCIEDEIPFELPKGWAWTRIGSIATVKGGKRVPKGMTFSSEPTQHAYVRVTDMKNHTVNLSDLKYIDETVFAEIKNYTIAKNDLYITIAGTIGAVGEFPDELDGMNLTENAVKVTAISLNKTFLCLMMQTEYVQKQFKHKTYQVAMPKLGLERILTTLIPICSLSTQNKICKAVNDASIYIDIISENYQGLSDTITVTKSKILDLAIRGKLVPQDPSDEPASALLERIRTEKEELIKQGKIKRDKKESVIFKGEDNSYYEKIDGFDICIDEKIPFSLPENWRWERLGNISTIARGGSPRPIEDYLTESDDGINWIKIGDTEQGGKYISSTREKIIPAGLSKTRYVKSGDFLLTNSMSFGRPYILKTDGCIHDGWLVIGDIENVFNQDYLYYALSSGFMYKSFSEVAAGSTVKNLKSDTVKAVFFPVPPYDEQVRIANYVEKLFAAISSIEKSLSWGACDRAGSPQAACLQSETV